MAGLTFRLGQLPDALQTDASNNVGIGGSPSGSYKLEVTGTAKVSSTLLVSGASTLTGAVGIGTAPNARQLQVTSSSDGNYSSAVAHNGTTSNSFGLLIDAGTNSTDAALRIRSKSGAADLMIVNGAGNVGIGVTPSSWGSGYLGFQFGPAGSQFAYSNAYQIGLNYYFDGSAYKAIQTGASSKIEFDGANIYFKNSASVSAGSAQTVNETMRITSGGLFLVNVTSSAGFGTAHRIYRSTSEGDYIIDIDGGGEYSSIFMAVTGGGYSTAKSAVWLGKNSSTNRSINAGGTINASGADYAEYMTKAIKDNITKGDIVGVNENGLLTNVFADAKSFVVKSTNPSYVGGDTWGSVDIMGKLEDDATDEEKEAYNNKLEEARAKVDRIAFSGQVPCNVYDANVGDYIIPIDDNGKIKGQAITNPTFEQYQLSVGKVWKIMEDGRAWIAVKIG